MVLLVCFVILSIELQAQGRKSIGKSNAQLTEKIDSLHYPDQNWNKTKPELLGYSSEKLELIRSSFLKTGGEAMMIIVDGYVIADWGKTNVPFDGRSLRKGFMHALLGPQIAKGTIHLESSMGDLNIQDKEPLSGLEKTSKVKHLMKSASGVYLKANYESKENANKRPERDSHEPGEFFYYNNWDYNVLGTILENAMQEKIPDAFEKQIASRLNMQDYSVENVEYSFFGKNSKHPAVLFETSARDDARFGLLYLRDGKWKNEQIVPKEWIDMSTKTQIETGDYWYYNYGYLWWTTANGGFLITGNGGQYVYVNPKEKLVVVFRSDPGPIYKKWLGLRVSKRESHMLISGVINSRIKP